MFLVSYVLFQLPGTLLIKKISAPVQFCGAMLTVTEHLSQTPEKPLANRFIHYGQWGLLTVLTILVKSSGQLIAMRFLIGAAEAFVQGGAFCTCLPPNSNILRIWGRNIKTYLPHRPFFLVWIPRARDSSCHFLLDVNSRWCLQWVAIIRD